MIYGGTLRSAARLKQAGYPVLDGPGPLVQVFRINSTRGPFKNAKFRQAFNYLMDREAILRAGLCRRRPGRRPALGAVEPGLRPVLREDLRVQPRQGEGAAGPVGPQPGRA